MTGQLIGQLILWLILAVIVIFILYWVMNWLYRRSTKEVAFVRTGFLGEKVVIDGGAFVWPIIHDITPVNMNTLQLAVVREREDALNTRIACGSMSMPSSMCGSNRTACPSVSPLRRSAVARWSRAHPFAAWRQVHLRLAYRRIGNDDRGTARKPP